MRKDFFWRFILFTTYFFLVLYVYENYLVFLYSYRGSSELVDPLYRGLLVIIAGTVCSLVTPSRIKSPGDFILAIFSVAVIPSVFVLQGASVFATNSFGYCSSVIVSMVILAMANQFKVKNNLENWIVNAKVVYIYVFFNILALALMVLQSIDHFSMAYNEYYLRRQMAKNIFPSGAAISYYISIFVQGLYPIILIASITTKNYKLLLLSTINVVVLWGVGGEKYPIFLLILLVPVMAIYKYKNLGIALNILLVAACIFIVFGIIETESFGTMYINDYFLRRVYAVPAVLSDAVSMHYELLGINYYCDSLLGALSCDQKDISITYSISENILSQPEMNANVNFIAMAFLRMSYLAVFLEVLTLSSILVFLNTLFYKKENYYALAVGVMLSLRLLEQSLPTVLLSSGGIVVIILATYAYKKNRDYSSQAGS